MDNSLEGNAEGAEPKLLDELKAELRREFDAKYKSEITGLNRKVSELTSERDNYKAEVEGNLDFSRATIKEVQDYGQKLKLREQAVKQRERAIERCLEKDISPNLVIKLAGLTDSETDESLDLLLSEIDRIAKNSRNAVMAENIKRPESAQAEHRLTLAEFKRMSAAEQARIPSSVRIGLLGGNS